LEPMAPAAPLREHVHEDELILLFRHFLCRGDRLEPRAATRAAARQHLRSEHERHRCSEKNSSDQSLGPPGVVNERGYTPIPRRRNGTESRMSRCFTFALPPVASAPRIRAL